MRVIIKAELCFQFEADIEIYSKEQNDNLNGIMDMKLREYMISKNIPVNEFKEWYTELMEIVE